MQALYPRHVIPSDSVDTGAVVVKALPVAHLGWSGPSRVSNKQASHQYTRLAKMDHAIRTPPSTLSSGTVQRQRVNDTYLQHCTRIFFDGTNSIPLTGMNNKAQRYHTLVPPLSLFRPIPILSHPYSVLYLLIIVTLLDHR